MCIRDSNWGFPTNSPVKANRQCTRIMKKVENNLGDIEKYESYRLDDAQVCVCLLYTSRCV